VLGADPSGVKQFLAGTGSGQLADGEVGDSQLNSPIRGQGIDDGGAEAALGMVVLDEYQPSPRRGGGRLKGGEGSSSRYLPARATPTASGSPCPRDPVATSTHGSTGVG
jgi:hypothetical protein